jgi:hypothetical protein
MSRYAPLTSHAGVNFLGLSLSPFRYALLINLGALRAPGGGSAIRSGGRGAPRCMKPQHATGSRRQTRAVAPAVDNPPAHTVKVWTALRVRGLTTAPRR